MTDAAVGYAGAMRFKLGFAAGLAAGYWLGSTPADERRTKLDEMWSGIRDNPRLQRVTETVSTDARRLGDAVEERFVKTADGAVDAVAGTVEPDPTSKGSSTASSSSGSTGTRKSA
jgi:hypothetical protein